MSASPPSGNGRGGLLATAGMVVLPLLCCGLPLLLASGVAAGITGAAWGGIGGALAAAAVVATAVTVVVRRRHRRRAQGLDSGCCPPASSDARQRPAAASATPREPGAGPRTEPAGRGAGWR